MQTSFFGFMWQEDPPGGHFARILAPADRTVIINDRHGTHAHVLSGLSFRNIGPLHDFKNPSEAIYWLENVR